MHFTDQIRYLSRTIEDGDRVVVPVLGTKAGETRYQNMIFVVHNFKDLK